MPSVGFGMGQACLMPPEWVISWDKSVLIRQRHSWHRASLLELGSYRLMEIFPLCFHGCSTQSTPKTPKTWYKPENVKNQCCTITTLICDLSPGVLPPELFHYAAAFFLASHMKFRVRAPPSTVFLVHLLTETLRSSRGQRCWKPAPASFL